MFKFGSYNFETYKNKRFYEKLTFKKTLKIPFFIQNIQSVFSYTK